MRGACRCKITAITENLVTCTMPENVDNKSVTVYAAIWSSALEVLPLL